MTREEIINALQDDKTMPFIQPDQLAMIVDFVSENCMPSIPDLDEAAKEYARNYIPFDQCDHRDILRIFKAGAVSQYQKDRREFAEIKAKIWCEGFDARKSLMMKNAIETRILTTSFINLPKEYLHQNGIQAGDKVRVILIPEEQK